MPSTVQALVVLAFVLVPGFLFMATLRRSVSNLDRSDLRLLLGTIPAGVLCNVLTFLWTARLLRIVIDDPERLLDNSHTIEVVAWIVVTIFLVPTALGAAIGRLVKRPHVDEFLEQYGYGYINLLPSAWEYVFDKKQGYYVRIHLKSSNSVIGGVYGTDSFAADPPRPSDIYIEQLWLLDADGDFIQPLPTTRGAWVSQDEIAYIEFFAGQEDANGRYPDERQPKAEATSTGTQGQPAEHAATTATASEDAKTPE